PAQRNSHDDKCGQLLYERLETAQASHRQARQPRLRTTREARFSFQFKLHQIVERDTSNAFQTFRADFVQCVPGSVPWWKIEIDQIDHRNPDLVKRSVIIGDSTAEISEVSTLAERIGGGKNVASQVSRRIRRQRYIERSVPDHIEEDSAANRFRFSRITQLLRKMAATVEPIGCGKVFECFFAIEKQKLDLCGKGRAHCQDPGHFNEQPCARSAVIRANKANGFEGFGVVVRAKKKLRCLLFFAGPKACNQIYKCHFAARSLVGKFRASYGPTG